MDADDEELQLALLRSIDRRLADINVRLGWVLLILGLTVAAGVWAAIAANSGS